MTALTVYETPLQRISAHAIERYCERVDPRREVARIALFRMYRCSRVATEAQLRMLHIKIDYTATYRISDTSLGLYMLIIKEGCLVTILPLENR